VIPSPLNAVEFDEQSEGFVGSMGLVDRNEVKIIPSPQRTKRQAPHAAKTIDPYS
jgi:hypothetical protein